MARIVLPALAQRRNPQRDEPLPSQLNRLRLKVHRYFGLYEFASHFIARRSQYVALFEALTTVSQHHTIQRRVRSAGTVGMDSQMKWPLKYKWYLILILKHQKSFQNTVYAVPMHRLLFKPNDPCLRSVKIRRSSALEGDA